MLSICYAIMRNYRIPTKFAIVAGIDYLSQTLRAIAYG